MEKVLADWLKDKYVLDRRGNVKSKEKMFFSIKGEQKEIPEEGLWFQTFSSKSNPSMITNVIPTLLHSYCLKLAEQYSNIVKLNTAIRTYHRWPWDNADNTLHCYMTIQNEDGVFADGEGHVNTVQKTMLPYICTIMNKRAEDRLILKALDLYAQGFYSDSEFVDEPEEDFKSGNSLSAEELERIKLKQIILDVKGLFTTIAEYDSNFSPKVFTSTVLGDDKESSAITLSEWEVVKEAATNELKRLERKTE